MQKTIYLNVDDLIINPENPRHPTVLDSSFAILELLKEDKEALLKLILCISKSGYYPAKSLCVIKSKIPNKYVLLDGNRRITAVKLLLAPELAPNEKEFKNFRNKIISIRNDKKTIDLSSLKEVPCVLYDKEEDAYEYLLTIHTNSTDFPDEKKWTLPQQNRFKEKTKSARIDLSYMVLKNYLPNVDLSQIKNMSLLERLLKTKHARYKFKFNNVGFSQLNANVFTKILEHMINDFNTGKQDSRTLNNLNQIIPYINSLIEMYDYSSHLTSPANTSVKTVPASINRKKHVQQNIFDETKQMLEKSNDINNLEASINNKTIASTSSIINIINDIPFINIDISKLDMNVEQAKGINNLAYEIKGMSKNIYKNYTIAYTFLIRSILEQSITYFFIKKEKWEDILLSNNNKSPGLEKLIEKFYINRENLVNDDVIMRSIVTCFGDFGQKNYFDLVIHHPYKIAANPDVIKAFADIGLYQIIQYFINS